MFLNCCPGLRAFCLWIHVLVGMGLHGHAVAGLVQLGNLTQDYTGSAITPTVVTDPAGLPVTMVYRDLAPADPSGSSETVFNNTPNALPLSYSSYSFSSNGASALGNYVRLAGNARRLESCEVILVTWARASHYPGWAAINPTGYEHPVSVTLYTVNPANGLTLVATLTRNVLVPWRPETLPSGQPYPFNGYAFRVGFDFPDAVILPEQVMVMVDYDTENSGFSPIRLPGPYNELNVALDGGNATTGADVNPDVVLRVTSDSWFYPNTNWSGSNGPLTRLRARSTITKSPPAAPGSYEVTAMGGLTGTEGTAQGTLTILPPSFAKWQNREFTEAQRTAGAALPGADPDGDGWTNLTEYALGTSPAAPTGEPPWVMDPSGMAITLDRPRWLTGVSYIAEESSDLSQWDPVPLQILATGATRETVRATASPGALSERRAYLRIRFAE